MVRRPLETEGAKGVEEKKKDSSTQVEKGERRKILKVSQYFSMCAMSEANSPL